MTKKIKDDKMSINDKKVMKNRKTEQIICFFKSTISSASKYSSPFNNINLAKPYLDLKKTFYPDIYIYKVHEQQITCLVRSPISPRPPSTNTIPPKAMTNEP